MYKPGCFQVSLHETHNNFVLSELTRVKSPQEDHKSMYRQISIREIRVLELWIEADVYDPRSLQFK